MKICDILPWLTVFIFFSIKLKSVNADFVTSPNPRYSTQLLCPNSSVWTNYSTQSNEIYAYQSIRPCLQFYKTRYVYHPFCPACPSTSAQPLSVTKPQTSPPEQLKECPPGSLLINAVCRLIYCDTQSIYRDGKCLQVECAESTYWNGYRCENTSESLVHTINFNSTLTTYINSFRTPIVINNINNVTLNGTTAIDDNNDEPEETETTKQPSCCTVITPRMCKLKIKGDRKKWRCYSKRYRRCSGICVAPIVHLKAPYASGTDFVTVIPPDNYLTECRRTRTCPESNEMYDCSGCITGRPENCSQYCYRSVCSLRRCQYYNQRDFCEQYPGEQGCLEEDGCFNDWCGGNVQEIHQEHNYYEN